MSEGGGRGADDWIGVWGWEYCLSPLRIEKCCFDIAVLTLLLSLLLGSDKCEMRWGVYQVAFCAFIYGEQAYNVATGWFSVV